jgi:hypothetical protein
MPSDDAYLPVCRDFARARRHVEAAWKHETLIELRSRSSRSRTHEHERGQTTPPARGETPEAKSQNRISAQPPAQRSVAWGGEEWPSFAGRGLIS